MMSKGVKTWLKINALAILIGIVGGLGAIIFRQMIGFFQNIFFNILLPHVTYMVGGYNLGIIILPAIGGLIVGPIINKVAPETKGHGVPEVLEAVTMKGGNIRARVAAIKIIVSSLTIGSGGSVGREGPIAQIGSSFGSFLGQRFNLEESYRKLLVVCGLSAGISGTFMAPLGGALFGIEVIYSGVAPYDIIPVLLSSVVGMFVTAEVFGMAPAFILPTYRFSNPLELAYFIPFGLFFGVLSIVWTHGLYKFEDFFDDLHIPEWVKPGIGGLITGFLGMFFVGYGILGTGYEGLEQAIAGNLPLKLLLLLGIVKFLSTSITIGSGSSGGIFAPSLYMGGMIGGALGLLMVNLPFASSEPFVYTLVGMAALFAGAARAPLTCVIMLPEMSANYYLFPPLMLACATSYFTNTIYSKDSIYTLKLRRRGVNISKTVSPLHLVYVNDVMTPMERVVTVKPDTPVSVVNFMIWETEHTGFPVVDDSGYYGMIRMEDIYHIPDNEKEHIASKTVAKKTLPKVFPTDNIYSVMEKMNEKEHEILPVLDPLDEDRIIGVISDSDVLHAFSIGTDKMRLFE
ncbi:CBS domain-containing protein [Candidatus Bathyarchaeota archaeon]|nr:CBS domain-containing protein [Candidatus Bathyarchaeota archaeon]